MERPKPRRKSPRLSKRKRAARRRKRILMIVLIAVILILLLILGFLLKDLFIGLSALRLAKNPSGTGGVFSKSSPLFSEQEYYHDSKIQGVAGNCFVIGVDPISGGFNDHAIISFDGKVIRQPDRYSKPLRHYSEIGDGMFILGNQYGVDFMAFECYDSNGQLVGSFSGSEDRVASRPTNGNYHVTTQEGEYDSTGMFFKGTYTTTFYRLDGSVICSVNGYARSDFNQDGFAVISVENGLGRKDIMIDTSGNEIPFTIAEGSVHAGKRVDACKFEYMEGDRCAVVNTITLDDGTTIEGGGAIINREKQQICLIEDEIKGVYDAYVNTADRVYDRFGEKIIFDHDDHDNLYPTYPWVLSETEPYFAGDIREGMVILDAQGNIIGGPHEYTELIQNYPGEDSFEANAAGLFAVGARMRSGNTLSAKKYGVMNLKGEYVAPPIYESVVCSPGGYAVLDGKEIIDANGQVVFAIQ